MGWCWKSIKSSANQTIKIYKGNPTISLERAPAGLYLRLFPAYNWTEPGWVTQSNVRFTRTKCHLSLVRVLGLALTCRTKRERFQHMNFRAWKEYLFQVGRFDSIVLQSIWLGSLQSSGWKALWEFLFSVQASDLNSFLQMRRQQLWFIQASRHFVTFMTRQDECMKPGNSL